MSTETLQVLRSIHSVLVRAYGTVNPGPLGITLKELDEMFKVTFTLPQADPSHPETSDILKGQLRVSQGDALIFAVDTVLGQETYEAQMEIGDYMGVFAFVDEVGNESTVPAVLEFTVSDTVAPSDPVGPLGITLVEIR